VFTPFARRAAGDQLAGFALAKRVEVAVDLAADDAALARAHHDGLARHRELARGGAPPESPPGATTLLDLKLELARRLLAPCRLCGLRCGVDRRAGPAGVCGLGPGIRRYADFVHLGEELEIIPTHAVFLEGCSYRCSYCSDWDHVAATRAPEIDPAELARAIDRRRAEGAATLSFVGGDPLVNVPGILAALAAATVSAPVVFTTNGHATEETLDVLDGVVDGWIVDWKHGNDACARAVARAPDHVATLERTLARVARETFTIVRHLVLPGHVECCSLPVLDRTAAVAPGARVNVMAQYRPTPRVLDGALGRRPTADEVERVVARTRELGLATSPIGRVAAPATSAPTDTPPGFESSILIDDDGRVTVENLSPDLAQVVRALAAADPELRERLDAGGRWRGQDRRD
jgi:putative pyruvate formate lyase activating enzyme